MYQVKIQFKGTCPHHRNYSPVREGEGGIKGGCVYCFALQDVWMIAQRLKAKMNEADAVLKGEIT